jgi:phage terminase large subunit-like protein
MRAGPKEAASNRALPLGELPETGGERVVAFLERFIVIPKGAGARERMQVRPWQRELICGVFDDPRPRLALWSLPRGQGKSSMSAAIGLYGLHADGEEGASVVCIAADERQARLVFGTASRMTELQPSLAKRTQVYQDRLYVPRSGSTFQVLPAEPHRLEGLDPSIAIVDEIGVVDRRAYEVVALASGKRSRSLVLCIGTPSPDGQDSVMFELVAYGREHPDERGFRLVEFAAADPSHPVSCRHCWAEANPGLDDLIKADALEATLPPKTRESTYRRVRLGQWVDLADEPWLPPGLWASCEDRRPIPDDADVTIGLDGSFSQDCTALVAVTVEATPHIDVVALWEPPPGRSDYRVPVADVEQEIREACRRFAVREIVADPYRWTRSLQALEAEGLPVVEFPQSAARMTPATIGMHEALVNRQLTHSGDARLAQHVANAVARVDSRGTRLAKEHRHSRRRIDLCVAALMALARASELAAEPDSSYDVLLSAY